MINHRIVHCFIINVALLVHVLSNEVDNGISNGPKNENQGVQKNEIEEIQKKEIQKMKYVSQKVRKWIETNITNTNETIAAFKVNAQWQEEIYSLHSEWLLEMTALKEKLDKRNSDLKDELDKRNGEFALLKRENMECKSVGFVRTEVEFIEKRMKTTMNIPEKHQMIGVLKNKTAQQKFLIPIFEEECLTYRPNKGATPATSHWIEGINKNTNIHEMTCLFFLLTSTSYFADRVRDILAEKRIAVQHFCYFTGRVFEVASIEIHYRRVEDMTEEEKISGLNKHGIHMESLRDCLRVIKDTLEITYLPTYGPEYNLIITTKWPKSRTAPTTERTIETTNEPTTEPTTEPGNVCDASRKP